MKRLLIDLDGTLTIDEENVAYEDKRANLALIERLKEYKKEGFIISIFTSRNMRSFKGDMKRLEKHTLPMIKAWLKKHEVPYDEIILGKAWCGFEGFYVDDRAIRPSEFVSKGYDEIKELLNAENPLKKGGEQ
ncbi:capsular biosynthesis protein [Campylobacter sp. MIT 99-7217]|uniref:HAD-IIIC family phosphatase n=1 Tax=Campylobacter sp. MIT 99-7217 TaxID=535091 RepID=UPI0011599B8A|nr:HAD-IIIC family phosphatase [Campylobacter sp. MIT 99-7217]TQR34591.1 capsular biosynthesis protein [Campylobacter sp. MIT 99-7217]